MKASLERLKLDRLVQAFLSGESRQYHIIKTRIDRYLESRFRGSPSEREDLVSDILMALIDALRSGRFRGETVKEFNGYLYGTARFKMIQALERRGRTPIVEDPAQTLAVVDEKRKNPHQETADKDLIQKIYEGLDVRCRELLRLRFEENWTDQEIADQVGKTRNAVSTAVSRCLQKARAIGAVKENLYQNRQDED